MEAITIMGSKPVWGLPGASPFQIKLETWLRMVGVEYRSQPLTRPPQSRTGKVPYILREDGSLLADSQVIVETVARERDIALYDGETAEDEARSRVIRRMVEDGLYFLLTPERYVDDAVWPYYRDHVFSAGPLPLRRLYAAMVRKKVLRGFHAQGGGRRPPDEVRAMAEADVEALARLLGEDRYFAGDRAGVVDASVYGLLAVVLGFPLETPLRRALKAQPNLTAFCRRIATEVWGTLPEAFAA